MWKRCDLNIIVVNDPHFSDTPPSVRNDDYLSDLLAKFAEIKILQDKLSATIVITGDTFHQKTARHVSHSLVRTCIELFNDLGKPLVLMGNHDILGGEVQSVLRQPLGVVLKSGALRLLTSHIVGETELKGVHYDESFESKGTTIDVGPKKTKNRVLFVHSLMEPGQRVRLKGEYDLCFYGHLHHDCGRDGKYINLGSLTRTRNEDWEWDRKLAVAILDTDTLEVRRYNLKRVRPWDEVRTIELPKLEVEENPFDAFVRSIQLDSSVAEASVEDVLATLDKEVREVVLGHIRGS